MGADPVANLLDPKRKAQIALEFIMIYSFVLLVFTVLLVLVLDQRAVTLNQQQYAYLQVVAQSVAGYLDQAAAAGNGYSATLPLPIVLGPASYSLYITSTGVVIATMGSGSQAESAQAFSNVRNVYVSSTQSTNTTGGISIYTVPISSSGIYLANVNGVVYVDQNPQYTPGAYTSGALSGYAAAGISNGNVPAATVLPISTQNVAQFNGQAHSEITIPNSQPLQYPANQLTWVVWFNTPTSNAIQGVMGQQYNSYISFYLAGDGYLRYQLQPGAQIYTAPGAIHSNTWYQAVMTFNGATLTAYLNGAYVGSGSSDTPYPDIARITLGYFASYYFNGSLSNFQIYNTSLSANQVKALYQEGIGGTPILPANIIAWYPLNGNANDLSGNGNPGTPTNVIWAGNVISTITPNAVNVGSVPNIANTIATNTIIVNGLPSVSLSPLNSSIFTGAIQNLTASVVGGTSPYTYLYTITTPNGGTYNAIYRDIASNTDIYKFTSSTVGLYKVNVTVTDSATTNSIFSSGYSNVNVSSGQPINPGGGGGGGGGGATTPSTPNCGEGTHYDSATGFCIANSTQIYTPSGISYNVSSQLPFIVQVNNWLATGFAEFTRAQIAPLLWMTDYFTVTNPMLYAFLSLKLTPIELLMALDIFVLICACGYWVYTRRSGRGEGGWVIRASGVIIIVLIITYAFVLLLGI